jgi:glutathione S-transferase
MLRLYDYLPSGNGYKVRLLLNLLGVPFERIELDIDKGETRTPAFLAMNPNGRIPLLELEDGRRLAESDAILFYLADGTEYWPAGRFARAQVLQWMFFEQYTHEPSVAVARYILHHTAPDSPRRAELPGLHAKGRAALGVMEGELAGRPFFVGAQCTIADLALCAYTHVAGEGGFDLQPYPAIRRWLDRIAALPGYVPITQA